MQGIAALLTQLRASAHKDNGELFCLSSISPILHDEQSCIYIPRPRAATSVATRMGALPPRNSFRTQSLSS